MPPSDFSPSRLNGPSRTRHANRHPVSTTRGVTGIFADAAHFMGVTLLGGDGDGVARRPDKQTLSTHTDEALVARVATGDAQAFRVLADRHLDRTVSLARRVLGAGTDAEDVAQEAFTRLWQHAERFRPSEARFSTWFYRITVNLCLDRRRRPAHDNLDNVPEPTDPTPDATTLIERSELRRLIAHAVAGLPERQRAAISLCYDAGLSNAEAATAMAVSVGALETLLVRARRSLRATLAPLAPPGAPKGADGAGRARRGGPR